jgi:hypothetical protein
MAYSKIEGERPDIATQRVRDKGESLSVPGTEEFKALLARSADGATADASPQTRLLDYVTPVVKDGGIFQENRIISALEQLLDLPMFKEDTELAQSMNLVVTDELARFVDVRERRGSGIAA